MEFRYNDGGRVEAGYKGNAGDCVIRSIAIATDKPYQEIYNTIFQLMRSYAQEHNNKVSRQIKRGNGRSGTTPRNGVPKPIYTEYLKSIGWRWTPTMHIGSGCKVHLKASELPKGQLIVSVSKHMTAVLDGVIHDTHDPQRSTIIVENGVQRIVGRCVYGYWTKCNVGVTKK